MFLWALAVVVVVKPIGKISNRICACVGVVCIKAKKKRFFFSLVRFASLRAFHSTEIGQMFFEMKCEWFLFGRRRRFLCLRARFKCVYSRCITTLYHTTHHAFLPARAQSSHLLVKKKIHILSHIYIIFVYAWFYAVRWWWFHISEGKIRPKRRCRCQCTRPQ